MLPTPRVVFTAPRTYSQILTAVKRRWKLLSPALEACPSWMISAGGQRERMTGKWQPCLQQQWPPLSSGQLAMGWHLTISRLRRPSSGRGGEDEEGTCGDGGSWCQQCPVQQDRYKVARSMARFAAHTQRPPRHPAEGGAQGYGSAPPPHGQMGLSPANCRKVITACVQFIAMFGAELWHKGDHVLGTMGQADELQLLVNQEAWAMTGCLWTTNLGALSMELGLRATTAQPKNRQRRFRLPLLSLLQGDQGRGIVGARTAIGRWL